VDEWRRRREVQLRWKEAWIWTGGSELGLRTLSKIVLHGYISSFARFLGGAFACLIPWRWRGLEGTGACLFVGLTASPAGWGLEDEPGVRSTCTFEYRTSIDNQTDRNGQSDNIQLMLLCNICYSVNIATQPRRRLFLIAQLQF
jgi:hypothetical protein